MDNRLLTVPGPVGIEEAQKKVIELLDLTDPSPRAVVIYGFGGIGKTTLANAVFNGLDLSGYNICRVCMVKNPTLDDLKDIQEQMLRDILQIDLKLNNCYEGQQKLMNAFVTASKPFFLFIDNALRRADLVMLLSISSFSTFKMLSRVLVTTRNSKQIYVACQVYSYRVGCLSRPQAKRLLFHCAFGGVNGSFDRDVNLDGLLQICSGIPLALKMVGSKLGSRGNTVSACNEILKEMEDLQGFDEDLSERVFDFVYGQLDDLSKAAFLDIACFFYDWERSKVAGIVGMMELEYLEGASLVTTSQEGRVNMYDIVRARGRNLSEGNRITDRKTLRILLRDPQKLKKIEGIWLDDDHDYDIKAKHLDLMSQSLRVVYLGDRTRLNGRCKRAFKQLRFLRVSYQNMLSNPLKRLRKSNCVLIVRLTKPNTISEAEFTIPNTFYRPPSSFGLPKLVLDVHESLRVLYLKVDVSYPFSYSYSKKNRLARRPPRDSFRIYHRMITGGFHRERLIFINGPSLRELHLSLFQSSELRNFLKLDEPLGFEYLSSLQILRMPHCSILKRFSDSFSNLSSLRELDMSHCSKLERLSESFGNLSSLQILRMPNCSELVRFPDSFGNLSSLRELDTSHCSKLERLPENFGLLSSLQILRMPNCSNLKELPENFGNLSSIRHVDMSDCSKLEIFTESFGNLVIKRAVVTT